MAKKQSDKLRIEYFPLEEVMEWPRNPRQHDDAALERSLKRYGFVSPLLRDESSQRLVAGHGRLGALKALQDAGEPPPSRIQVGTGGRWMVPVICGVTFSTAGEAESYLIADNRLAEIGGWDMDSLREMVKDLSAEGLELDALGWSAAALDQLVAEEPEKPRKKPTISATDEALTGVSSSRMIPLYVGSDEYQSVVGRMRGVMDTHKLPDYTALLLFLLDHYDATRPKETSNADPFNAEE